MRFEAELRILCGPVLPLQKQNAGTTCSWDSDYSLDFQVAQGGLSNQASIGNIAHSIFASRAAVCACVGDCVDAAVVGSGGGGL